MSGDAAGRPQPAGGATPATGAAPAPNGADQRSEATRARDVSRPLPFVQGTRGVVALSLEGMLASRRSLVVALFLWLPVVFALVFRLAAARLPPELGAYDLYGLLIAFFYVRNALPLAALFYATALVSDEVEGRTLTFLLTRPVARRALLSGKFAAYVATTLTLALPPLVVCFFLLASAGGFAGLTGRMGDLLRDLGVAALALVAYGALFTLLGVLLRRPLIPGLLFLFVWELMANLPGYLPRLTLTAWLRSLITHRPPGEGLSELFAQTQPTGLSLLVLAGATAVFLGLAAGIFSRREYVLDQ
jgi:ABC-2 type transport system permease protein